MISTSLICFIVTLILVFDVSHCAVDKTLERHARGAEVVIATVSKIKDANIFSDDRHMLRHIAYVESRDGTDLRKMRVTKNGKPYFGGIWQVSLIDFRYTQNTTSHAKLSMWWGLMKRKNNFDIDWLKVEWADLVKPLYSALAARIRLEIIRPKTGFPFSIREQAILWKQGYIQKTDPRPTTTFSKNVEELEANKTCNSKQADMIICLDSSRSVGSDNFQKMLRFLQTAVTALPIGENKIHFAILQFSDITEVEVSLKADMIKNYILRQINDITYQNGLTRTDYCLNKMRSMFLENSRIGVPKVGVVITDGQSNEPKETVTAANIIKKAKDITMYAVQVGDNYNRTELRTIASSDTNIINLNFKDFDFFYKSIELEACMSRAKIPSLISKNKTKLTHNFATVIDQTTPAYYSAEIPPQGLTFAVKTADNAKTAEVYASYTFKNPSSAIYDIKTSTKDGGEIFIPARKIESRVRLRRSAVASYESKVAESTAYISVFAESKGTTELNVTIRSGNHVSAMITQGNMPYMTFDVVLISALIGFAVFVYNTGTKSD